MKKSQSLFQKAQKLLVGGVNSPVRAFKSVGGHPVFMARGKGAHVLDADGKRYIDYLGSWGPLILGHAHPTVAASSMKAMYNSSSFGAPTACEVELASLVQKAFPSMERMRFVSSGTEACMSALRLARGFTKRKLVLKFTGCYHGHSDCLLVSAGSGAATFGQPNSAGVPEEFTRLTCVLPYNNIPALESFFKKHGNDLAAVIVEPVAGNMGAVAPDLSFLHTLRQLTKEYESVLIFDEVITGFRLSWGGAQGLFKIKPDLSCLGKIIGGGFPVGAFGGRQDIMEQISPLGPVYQAGTLSGNPVAMTAGLTVVSLLKKLNPYQKLEQTTHTLVKGIQKSAQAHNVPITINTIGSMFTVFFTNVPVTDYASAEKSNTQLYAKFFQGLLKKDIYFPPAQFESAFVSTTHTPADIQKTIEAMDQTFHEIR